MDERARAGELGAVNYRPQYQRGDRCHVHTAVLLEFSKSQGVRDARLDLVRASREMDEQVESMWASLPEHRGKRAEWREKLRPFWFGRALAHKERQPAWFTWGSDEHPARTAGIGAAELQRYCAALQRYRTLAASWTSEYALVLARAGRSLEDVIALGRAPAVADSDLLNSQQYEHMRGLRGAAGEDLQEVAQLLNAPGRPAAVEGALPQQGYYFQHNGDRASFGVRSSHAR